MPTGIIYDLASSPAIARRDGPLVYAFDAVTQSLSYTETLIQSASSWEPLALNTEGLTGFFLIEQTQPENISGGMVKWTRIYSEVPANRIEFETVSYNYNTYVAYDPEPPYAPILLGSIVSFTNNVTTRAEYSYHQVPEDIEIDLGWKLFTFGSFYYHQGDNPFQDINNPPAFFLGEDSAITRWKGNIWQKVNRYVPIPRIEQGVF